MKNHIQFSLFYVAIIAVIKEYDKKYNMKQIKYL